MSEREDQFMKMHVATRDDNYVRFDESLSVSADADDLVVVDFGSKLESLLQSLDTKTVGELQALQRAIVAGKLTSVEDRIATVIERKGGPAGLPRAGGRLSFSEAGHSLPSMSLDDYFKKPFYAVLAQRLPWLVVLMIIQSFSATILGQVAGMLEKNRLVTLFIPMLVGTGGNAGNQPGVMVTRALDSGKVPIKRLLMKEGLLAIITGAIMGIIAFCRCWAEYTVNEAAFRHDSPEAMVPGQFCDAFSWNGSSCVFTVDGSVKEEAQQALAIACSVTVVVLVSVFLGIGFSVMLDKGGCDPAAGAAPLLTTVSDLVGISLLALVGFLILGN